MRNEMLTEFRAEIVRVRAHAQRNAHGIQGPPSGTPHFHMGRPLAHHIFTWAILFLNSSSSSPSSSYSSSSSSQSSSSSFSSSSSSSSSGPRTPVRVYTRSHQQLPIVRAASIHGKPSQIAHSDAHESMHGKPSRITHSDARESVHGKPSTIAHSDGCEYTRKAIEKCI